MKGFSLIEGAIALAIAAILLAIAIPAYNEYVKEAQKVHAIEVEQQNGVYRIKDVLCKKEKCTLTIPGTTRVMEADRILLLKPGQSYMITDK